MKIRLYYKRPLFVFLMAGLLFSGCEQPGGGPERYPDSNTALRSLSLSAGNLTPPFNDETTEYRVEVNNRVQDVTIQADPAGRNAVVSGTGTISLDEGEDTVTDIIIRAENGDQKTYSVTVTRLDDTVVSITSQEDLKKIGKEEGYSLAGDYKLKSGLTLTDWTPIAVDADHAFSGSLDGKNHTITLNSFDSSVISTNAYLGIFGYVKGSGSAKANIKNLAIVSKISQNSDPATRQAIGTLTGYAENTEIKGITLQGSFTFDSTKTIYAGGIAGYIQTGTVVKDCAGNAVLNISGGNGGTNLSGIQNEPYSYVGGMVGIFVSGGEILNCHNSGTITSVSDIALSQVFVGGITGGSYYARTPDYQGKIEDCSSTGNITAKCKGYWSWAGGIAGAIVGDGDGTPEKTTWIMRCWASGTVSVADSGAGYPYVGGIVGYNYYGALTAQSYFTGTVISNTDGDYTGGIAGYNSQSTGHNSRIEDCWSSGTVTGFHNAGGIVGQNQVNAYVRRCYSTAAVSVTDTCETNKQSTNPGVGGIAGMTANTLADAITGCVALNPSVTAADGTKIHRVAGWLMSSSATLKNNHAWSGMALTSGGVNVSVSGDADKVDGADCAQIPPKSLYEDLDWDFTSVWKMDGGDDYPVLQWQTP